mgnify:CR=1 FL=1
MNLVLRCTHIYLVISENVTLILHTSIVRSLKHPEDDDDMLKLGRERNRDIHLQKQLKSLGHSA